MSIGSDESGGTLFSMRATCLGEAGEDSDDDIDKDEDESLMINSLVGFRLANVLLIRDMFVREVL